MTAVASAPDNSRASTSAGPYQTVYEQRSAVAKAAEAAAREEVESGDGNRDLGFCQPALAATITRDAERLCEQQVSRGVQFCVHLRGFTAVASIYFSSSHQIMATKDDRKLFVVTAPATRTHVF